MFDEYQSRRIRTLREAGEDPDDWQEAWDQPDPGELGILGDDTLSAVIRAISRPSSPQAQKLKAMGVHEDAYSKWKYYLNDITSLFTMIYYRNQIAVNAAVHLIRKC